MPILLTAVASLALAWVRGAPPTELATIRLRWLALPLLAFGIQLMAFVRFHQLFEAAAFPLHMFSLGLLLAFFAANVRYRSLMLVGLGVLLNAAVIGANGGYMPVRIADVERAGFYRVAAALQREGHFQKSTVLEAGTPLWFLGDVLPVPLPNGPDRLISLGDILVAVGTFLFIQEALVGRRSWRLVLHGPATP
jgi:hypothetical protein